jgi:tetratricopeptide (TPR) repeat protein
MNVRPPTLQDAFALHGQGRLGEAARIYEAIIAREPNNAEARHYLGALLASAGRLDDAKAQMKRALQLKPNEFAFLENYIGLLVLAEDFTQALEFSAKALERQPRNPNLLYLRAVSLQKLDRLNEARVGFVALLSLAPGHPDGRKEYAATLSRLGELDEALRIIETLIAERPRFADAYLVRANIRSFRDELGPALADYERTLALKPKSVDALIGRGAALKQVDRLPEALASFDQAIALGGDGEVRGLAARGAALAEVGETEEARQTLRRATEFGEKSSGAWQSFVDLVRFEAGDPAFAAMEARLAEVEHMRPGEALPLHFALGKAYLDVGNSERAFAHFDAGNRLKRAQFAYDADANRARIVAIIAAFRPETFARFAGAGSHAGAPIFVVGMPRSGTTLIEQILASHPAIHGAGELHAMPEVAADAGGNPECVATLTADALARLGEDYLARVGEPPVGKTRVVDKLPANFFNAGLIRLILPEAQIIHVRRDPVDTCLSCYSKNFRGPNLAFANDLTELGLFYREYETLMAHWRATLPSTHFLEVEYESVVDDLEGQARRIIAFLGLPWDPACLEFHRTQRPVRTASVNQVRKPIYRASIGRWRAHAAYLGPLLKALGVEA